ncbi:hypothetical protein EUTSA_v10025430mg [Eutrema salsugineum]|uniref:ACB domain-containing protein n=1 Tax=Eutrema salsugineum TaxID=72664 RepID=V4P5W4_EUTSA|nr:acyl-CoA-binding domain-containing protein 3 isoform X2 [Eutrema salsugineum]ESQ54911.1 hypothetical protein EUTSA_v10025430mg [Eutrema salsugineum]
MEFFLEMLLTALVALLFSFLLAKLVSLPVAANGGSRENDRTSDHSQAEKHEIGVGGDTEELRFGLKVDHARVFLQSERNFRVVDENVEPVDRFGSEADQVVDELEEVTKGEDLVASNLEDASLADLSPENVVVEEIIVRGEGKQRDSSGEISVEREELIVPTKEDGSTTSVSPENVIAEEIMIRGQEEGSESTERRSVSAENTKSEEVKVEESDTVEESEDKMERNTEEERENEEEMSIEEDDDWEGIEKSELQNAFAASAKFMEESRKAEEIGAEAKMVLYGLHKIATEGPCREAQPMAVMVSARAKWNAWQKLGNMSQEEAMEQYLALVSKQIPGLMNTGHNVGKKSENETSVFLPPNSGPLEDPTTLDITGVESSKNVSGES